MRTLIKLSKYVFLIVTLLVSIAAVVGIFAPESSHTITLIYIAIAIGSLGVITTWDRRSE
jgi:hypothetical protein